MPRARARCVIASGAQARQHPRARTDVIYATSMYTCTPGSHNELVSRNAKNCRQIYECTVSFCLSCECAQRERSSFARECCARSCVDFAERESRAQVLAKVLDLSNVSLVRETWTLDLDAVIDRLFFVMKLEPKFYRNHYHFIVQKTMFPLISWACSILGNEPVQKFVVHYFNF